MKYEMPPLSKRNRFHLQTLSDFVDGPECVFEVFLRVSAHQTHRLFIIQTEELEFLSVNIAEEHTWWRVSLAEEWLADVPQREIIRWEKPCGCFPADGTLLPPSLAAHPLETLLTHTVTAGQEHGMAEDVEAHGTPQILLSDFTQRTHFLPQALQFCRKTSSSSSFRFMADWKTSKLKLLMCVSRISVRVRISPWSGSCDHRYWG